jgi:hypothetical protein
MVFALKKDARKAALELLTTGTEKAADAPDTEEAPVPDIEPPEKEEEQQEEDLLGPTPTDDPERAKPPAEPAPTTTPAAVLPAAELESSEAWALRYERDRLAAENTELRQRELARSEQQLNYEDYTLDDPVTRRELRDFEARVKQDTHTLRSETVHSKILRERQVLSDAVEKLAGRHSDFLKVVTKEEIERGWLAFCDMKDPNRFGQPWEQGLENYYRARNYDNIAEENKKLKDAESQRAAKADKRREQNIQNLGKIAKSGSSFQEPRETFTRKARPFRDLRGKALQLMGQQ